jgi:hypothetical protein
MLGLKPQDVKTRLSYHKSITTTIEREGKVETVRFRRGDKIWGELLSTSHINLIC